MKRGERKLYFLEILSWKILWIESSRRDLFINMIVNRFILKNGEITLCLCLTFIPLTGLVLPKTGCSFCCVPLSLLEIVVSSLIWRAFFSLYKQPQLFLIKKIIENNLCWDWQVPVLGIKFKQVWVAIWLGSSVDPQWLFRWKYVPIGISVNIIFNLVHRGK